METREIDQSTAFVYTDEESNLIPLPERESETPTISVDENALEVSTTPDIEFLREYLLSQELDPSKRAKLFDYIADLDADSLLALWESFKASYGPTPNQITLNDILASHLRNVENSKSLALRNSAIESEVRRFGSLYDQLERTFRISLSDTPLGEFRVDNMTAYMRKLQSDLTTLNSAILEMGQMLLVGTSEEGANPDSPEMAINIERAIKICAMVGYSARSWSYVYEHSTQAAVKSRNTIKGLQDSLKKANESLSALHEQEQARQRKLAELAINASTYVICNHSGFYVTTTNSPEDTEEYRLSPVNFTLTTDKTEALRIPDLELTRRILDAVRDWSESNIAVKRVFFNNGVNAETLFIGAESFIKVEE